MSAVLSRTSLLAVLAALAMAFAMALGVFASSASAQAEKFWLCHNAGDNKFVAIEVDDDSIPDAHTGHGDFILGPAEDFPTKPEATEACNAGTDTTTTTTTGTTTGTTT